MLTTVCKGVAFSLLDDGKREKKKERNRSVVHVAGASNIAGRGGSRGVLINDSTLLACSETVPKTFSLLLHLRLRFRLRVHLATHASRAQFVLGLGRRIQLECRN